MKNPSGFNNNYKSFLSVTGTVKTLKMLLHHKEKVKLKEMLYKNTLKQILKIKKLTLKYFSTIRKTLRNTVQKNKKIKFLCT